MQRVIGELGSLYLEASGLSAATSPLEFAALRDDIGLLVFVGTHAKVLDGLASVALAAEQNGVGAGRCPESELVKGENLTASVQDALASRTGEAQGRNGEFGHGQQPVVVGDSRDSNDNFARRIRVGRGLLGDAGEGDGRLVDFGEEKTAEDDLVKLSIRATSKEAVELDEKEQIRILALGGGPVTLLDVVAVEIDTHVGWRS